jgi:pimeloyl-ACP methyl ester carboxylesterase
MPLFSPESVTVNVCRGWMLSFTLLALSQFSAAAVPAAPAAQSRTCHLPGHEEPLRCVTIPVPLDYRQPAGDKLGLHVTVAPAFRQPARPDPLFVLAGGPGQAGSDILVLLDSTFRKVRATRDIVFVDQRGTGLSGKLDCDNTKTLEEQPLAEQEKIVAACLRSLDKPFAAYTTANSARDLEQIRTALGYGPVNVWGASYGTRLAQAYARGFPASVRALTLDGVASPEQIIFAWGADAQVSLDGVFKQCEQDRGCRRAYPDVRAQFKSLLRRVNAGEITLDYSHPRTTARTRMTLEAPAFIQTIRTALYSPNTRNRIPFLIDSAGKGNWSPFVAQMHAMSDIAMNSVSLGLMLSVVCAEDMPRLTPAIVAEEEHGSFLAGMEVKTIPAWCRYVNVPTVRYEEPKLIDVPVLLLSGGTDPVTPPHRAEETMKHMTHAQHFVVRNGGHVVSPLGCAPKLLREFLDRPNQMLDAQCLKDIPPVGFQLGAAGPQP